jgi:predicted nucleic acid-binding protein
MKVYLDNCVYNRPFDDLASQPRMFFEAFAFYIILKLAEQDKIHIVSSDALIYENEKISDPLRKGRIRSLFDLSKSRILFDEDIVRRAREMIDMGFRPMDSLHLSCAERGLVDYFVTCDDDIIKVAQRNVERLHCKIVSLIDFLKEVLYA